MTRAIYVTKLVNLPNGKTKKRRSFVEIEPSDPRYDKAPFEVCEVKSKVALPIERPETQSWGICERRFSL